jgi:metal-responsive CopG/Arc/MetJ family transcriptional regulator
MFGKNKISLEKSLFERVKQAAEKAGYSSVDEFVAHLLEREISKSEDGGTSDADVKKQLEGLGYIS